jgi:uncharacterized Zn-finger protein
VDKKFGNRIFKVKETVVTHCMLCNEAFKKPSITYYVDSIKKVVCPKCAEKYNDREMRIFIDMDEDPKTEIVKDW